MTTSVVGPITRILCTGCQQSSGTPSRRSGSMKLPPLVRTGSPIAALRSCTTTRRPPAAAAAAVASPAGPPPTTATSTTSTCWAGTPPTLAERLSATCQDRYAGLVFADPDKFGEARLLTPAASRSSSRPADSSVGSTPGPPGPSDPPGPPSGVAPAIGGSGAGGRWRYGACALPPNENVHTPRPCNAATSCEPCGLSRRSRTDELGRIRPSRAQREVPCVAE